MERVELVPVGGRKISFVDVDLKYEERVSMKCDLITSTTTLTAVWF